MCEAVAGGGPGDTILKANTIRKAPSRAIRVLGDALPTPLGPSGLFYLVRSGRRDKDGGALRDERERRSAKGAKINIGRDPCRFVDECLTCSGAAAGSFETQDFILHRRPRASELNRPREL
ncbi:MAG: hypothetical protein M1837_006177 [Sclerophora amabilis]|nr:MAG: hypothetical protein M1837_006177 [Sclerophora amabilis]